MKADRLNAFTDGVIAIVITIMVLELHVPSGDGRVLWANLFLLFWLTLVPFVIRWIGEDGITAWPVAAYGVILSMAALAYVVLERALIASDPDSPVRRAVEGKTKEVVSFGLYMLGIPAAFVSPWISIACYIAVAAMWLVPDRRFERAA